MCSRAHRPQCVERGSLSLQRPRGLSPVCPVHACSPVSPLPRPGRLTPAPVTPVNTSPTPSSGQAQEWWGRLVGSAQDACDSPSQDSELSPLCLHKEVNKLKKPRTPGAASGRTGCSPPGQARRLFDRHWEPGAHLGRSSSWGRLGARGDHTLCDCTQAAGPLVISRVWTRLLQMFP